MICPVCKKRVDKNHFHCHTGSKGGRAGSGAAKARTSEQARAASNARWAKKKNPEPTA